MCIRDSNSAPFSVTTAGFVKSTTGEIGGFRINSSEITSSNDALILRSRGEITGSQVLFTGGKIGGWNLSTTGLTDTTGAVQFSSTEASMSLGTGQEILMRGNSNSPFISIQPVTRVTFT